jgi:O-antigen/teichoic acid export membrane protein
MIKGEYTKTARSGWYHALLVQTAGAATNALLSFALVVALARLLGPAGFGHYSALLNGAVLALVLIEGGFATLGYREGVHPTPALAPWSGRLPAIVAGQLLLAALIVAMLPVGRWLGAGEGGWWAAVACMVAIGWMNWISATLRAAGRFTDEVLWQMGGRVLSLLLILGAVVVVESSPTTVFVAWLIAITLLVAISPGRRPPLPEWPAAVTLRMAALSMMLSQFGFIAMTRIDLLLIEGVVGDSTATAQYAAAARVAEAALLLFAPVINVVPRYLRIAASGSDRQKQMVRVAGLAVAGALLYVGLLLFFSLVLGEQLFELLFGQGYGEASSLLPWILAGLFGLLPAQLLGQAIIAINREWMLFAVQLFALAISVSLALWLMPQHGVIAMAWSMLAGQLLAPLMLLPVLWLSQRESVGNSL